MKVDNLGRRVVPPKGHVPLRLPPKLLAWSLAHPDEWPRYEKMAQACTKPEELEDIFQQLNHWTDYRPEP